MPFGRLQSFTNSGNILAQLSGLFRNPLATLFGNTAPPAPAEPAPPEPEDSGGATPPPDPEDTGEDTPPPATPDPEDIDEDPTPPAAPEPEDSGEDSSPPAAPEPGETGEDTPPPTASDPEDTDGDTPPPATPDPAASEPEDGGEAPARTLLYSLADDSGEYALYGDFTDDGFVFVISSTAAPVGANTTIWLNTDLDQTTGYQIWDWAGGSEYNVNIGADGQARLYTGAAGETHIADLGQTHAADGSEVEIVVPRALIGDAQSVRVLADVNDSVFLPDNYSITSLVVDGTPLAPPASAGSILIDGDLSDWAPETLLYEGQGYQLYGDLVEDEQGDGHFTFAIASDAAPIGANTTIWLNTDLDTDTGYQIWDFAGGAEFNININADGQVQLFTGAAGETHVADLDHAYAADGSVVEISVPRALLGPDVQAVSVLADVNDGVFLPESYSGANLVVDGTATAPPVEIGQIVIDGDLSDWDADSLLYEGQGYRLHGDLVEASQGDGYFIFAIASDSLAIGAETTIWLNTDLDLTTGHQIWGWSGGAEFNINIGADGKVRLFTDAAGQNLVADLDHAYGPDGSVIEIAVPRALLGPDVDAVQVLADVNNAVFLPESYAGANLVVGEAPVTPPVELGPVTVDGDLAEWGADSLLYEGQGYRLHGDLVEDAQGDGHFVFAIASDAAPVGANTTIWLNTDLDTDTGYQIWDFAGGAEFNINIDADGVARLYSGGAGETFVADLDHAYASDGSGVEISVPRALLGPDVQAVSVLVDVNDGVFLPESYSGANLVVGEAPVAPPVEIGPIVIDGHMLDWDAGSLLYEAQGYSLHGDLVEDSQGNGYFTFAIASDTAPIGAETTIWLNTDLDTTTGYQIWDFAGGAEYNINIDADGKAQLFTGAAGETFVADLDYAYNANRSVIEIAVLQALIDGALPAVQILADVNDSVFLPNDYGNITLQVGELPPPVVNPDASDGLQVAIVYSETTADNFYDVTAYGQLFMSAQNQAMQAGIPYDLLTEADLLDPTGLAAYDAIIFPGFSHARAAEVETITESLTTAMQDYGVGLIAAGNFLTNDESGAALPGDSYARMKVLLGVTLEGYGDTDGIRLQAGDGGNPILDGYADGQVIGDYANISYLNFTDVSGSGEVLFSQLVGTGGNTVAHDAVIATQTLGRNVHFATDAIMGNNNILSAAIDWVTQDSASDVSLLMTRSASLFFGRIDMDQAQELWDVADQTPGIYDAFVPIMAEWNEKYGFVGSFYIDIGADPEEFQLTDWAVSAPYYQALIALGGEIGSHSFTHPEDTNTLLADTPEILALIDLVDPRNPDAVDPWTLTQAEQDLLLSSYRFQFETSKLIIEQQLGSEITGAAVPGMPERIDATREMIQYYDYLSGGYSGSGAGYPGAFGYLTPDETGQVYLAPNMAFDFTLMEWLGMSIPEAQAYWLAEYELLMAGATTPIIAFPFHDYGPTNWDLGGDGPIYSLQMFETLIATAAADGAEFITGSDLAQRIDSFASSELWIGRDGDIISATVVSDNAGHFVLDLGGEGTIASVAGWYAWDGSSVFLDRDGGSFEITLGPQVEDVTRIASLPTRAELISVTGDGSDLQFGIAGAGEVQVALRSQGSDAVLITGADSGTVTASGDVLLTFDGTGEHGAGVSYHAEGATVAGSDGGDLLLSGAGDDMLFGGGGADHFVFSPGMGFDTILDFETGIDVIELLSFGFIDSQSVYDLFQEVSEGLELLYNGGADRLLLADLDFSGLAVSDILVDDFLFV